MPEATPDTRLVSIGVPVFNEATYLAMTSIVLLAQDYPNLEIVRSTTSTDASPRSAPHRDRDQAVLRAEANPGATANFNAVSTRLLATFSCGRRRPVVPELRAPQCVAALDAHPTAVIAA